MTKIAILFHIGNFSLWNEFEYYINNVIETNKDTDLYISYQKWEKKIQDISRKYPGCKIIQCDKGCDVGGQLMMMKYIIDTNKKYDYILKLHTKTDSKWRSELVDPIVGTKDIVKKVIKDMSDNKNIAMIASNKWKMKNDKLNTSIVTKISNKYGFSIPENSYFVGGTIFWFKWNYFLNFIHKYNVNLYIEYFNCEIGYCKNIKPTYMHSWERLFSLIFYSEGYIIKGYPIPSLISLAPPYFNWKKYLLLNPDISRTFKTEKSSLVHYIKHGRFESRRII